MESKKIFLTKEGLVELQAEYEQLKKGKRPDVLDRVTQARNMGDLSENAEYTAAREELAFIDGRIEELEMLLRQAVVIDVAGHSGGNIISIGSKVTVKIDGKKEIFTLVGEWEADPAMKKISHESPLGKALIGKTIGDEIEVAAPAGRMMYRIVSIS